MFVNIHHGKGFFGDLRGDGAVGLDLCVVPGPCEEIVGDSGCSPAAECDLQRAAVFNGSVEDPGGTGHDLLQVVRLIVVQTERKFEPGTERRGKQSLPCGGADERETGQIQADRAGARSLIDHDVDEKIFHGAVKIFLHSGIEAVDLVDEEDIALLQTGQQSGEIARFFDDRSAAGLDIGAFFVGDDVCEGGFPQSRGTAQKQMPQRLVTGLGSFHIDFQPLFDLILPGKRCKILRTERLFRRLILPCQCRCNKTFRRFHKESSFKFSKVICNFLILQYCINEKISSTFLKIMRFLHERHEKIETCRRYDPYPFR